MANHKATKKDMRQAAKRRERNRYYGKTSRNAIRDLRALTDKAAAGEKLPEVISMIDKLAKRFLGADKYPYRQATEKRLIVRISVDRISGMGPSYKNWS